MKLTAKRFIAALSITCIILISGCASFTDPARSHELGSSKSYWLDYDAYRRGTIFIQSSSARGKMVKTCSEPPPDVAKQVTDKFTVNVSSEPVNAETGAELSLNAIKLAQRTQTIQFLRESLYRLCELSINTDLTPDNISELYGKVMESAITMAETEKIDAENESVNAQRRLQSVTSEISKAGGVGNFFKKQSEHK